MVTRTRSRPSRSKFANPSGMIATTNRTAAPLGPFSGIGSQFVPTQVNPYLYEALRRAVPPLDGGIDALVSLDGIVRVEGESDALVDEIREWIETVPVNDAQKGLQSFYAGLGNERYEQGHAVGEWIVDEAGRGITGLRIADSKGLRYERTARGMQVWYSAPFTQQGGRRDGTDDAERIIRGTVAWAGVGVHTLSAMGYKPLRSETLVYSVNQPEADNPYGTSKLRSVEFVSTILLAVQNATKQAWERFGDPAFNVTYKTANPKASNDTTLEARRKAIAENLAQVLQGKRYGNSIDFVQALGRDDDLKIEVLGASGQILEIEMPARHLLEQILAKFRLASWMMGFQWNTSDRASDGQVEMALMDSKTRWESVKPYLTDVVATHLRLQGRTWKPRDWTLVQELPNLRDITKQAQADFLIAQTAMMLAQSGQGSGADDLPDVAIPGADPMGGGQTKALAPEVWRAVLKEVRASGAYTGESLRRTLGEALRGLRGA